MRLWDRLVPVASLEFQSTHPVRDATMTLIILIRSTLGISIHASRAGCDTVWINSNYSSKYFNPRIPCGMRRLQLISKPRCVIFQSTHPVRDATTIDKGLKLSIHISIHASRAGCDQKPTFKNSTNFGFQSTHPVRDATKPYMYTYDRIKISIHASRAGCDQKQASGT
mgnify:CR=1 FL=1